MSVLATRRMLRKTNVSFDEDDPRELLEMDGIEETTIQEDEQGEEESDDENGSREYWICNCSMR